MEVAVEIKMFSMEIFEGGERELRWIEREWKTSLSPKEPQ